MRLGYAGAFYQLHAGSPLTQNEHAVLIYMCAIAMDGATPPRFWQGREVLAEHALGRAVPGDPAKRRSLFESVRKACSGLVERGAIQRLGGGHPGRSVEYALTVENLLPASLRDNVTLGHLQSDVGPLTTSGWQWPNAGLGPKTQETQDQEENPNHQSRPSHLRPVESGGTQDVA